MNRLERREQWEEFVNQFLASGLSGAAFCRQNNLKLASFYFWKRKLAEPQQASNFAQLTVVPDSKVEISFRNGAVLRMPFCDERSLRQVVSLLMERAENDS